jgi:hypothetical protein
MSNKYYIIAEYNYCGDAWEYVSRVGESPDDIWTSMVPYNFKGNPNDPPTPPVRFETKAAAQRILDPLKAARLAEWDKNSWYYKSQGRRKPQWKIYSMEG